MKKAVKTSTDLKTERPPYSDEAGISFYLMEEGGGVRMRGREYSFAAALLLIAPGDMILRVRGDYQYMALPSDSFLSLVLNPLYIKAPGKAIDETRPGFYPMNAQAIYRSCQECFSRKKAADKSNDPFEREMAILGLLIKVKGLENVDAAQLAVPSADSVWTIDDVAAHIRLCFDRPLTLDEMAVRCALNASYLSRTFKEKTGTTLFSFLNRIRIERACLLLKKSGMNITEIAFSVGYNNISFFNRTFKKTMGMTPGEYRKRIRR